MSSISHDLHNNDKIGPDVSYLYSNHKNLVSKDDFSYDNGTSISDFTEFKETFDMLTSALNSEIIFLEKFQEINFEDLKIKGRSKRKISEECLGIYGLAQKNVWDGNFHEAFDQCLIVINQYPGFWGSYDILSQIYEHKGNANIANQLNYLSVMCNPKDTEKWITCIETTKKTQGIDQALEKVKLAISCSSDIHIRNLYLKLLEEGGYEKEALKRELINLELAPLEMDPDLQVSATLDLFYLSEKFESCQDFKRASKCLETIDSKYPSFLSDEHRINLLKLMSKTNRFKNVFQISSKINHVQLTMDSKNFLQFSNEISINYKHQIILSCVHAAIYFKLDNFIYSLSFSDYIKELVNMEEHYIEIVNKLYYSKYFTVVLDLVKHIIDYSDNKLELLKIFGKTQEALGKTTDALATYNHIIADISEEDTSIWELKAGILFRLNQKEDAIQMLVDYQAGFSANRSHLSNDKLVFFQKICLLLFEEKKFDEFIRMAWKYLFIDSFEFFKINKISFCCEDISVTEKNIYQVQNDIWLTMSKIYDTDGHFLFHSLHSKVLDDLAPWKILEKLIKLLNTDDHHFMLMELLIQWGLVLQKFLNWNYNIRLTLSIKYITIAIMNRIKNPRLRLEVSGNMIYQELKFLRVKYGESVQFWNIFQIYSNTMNVIYNRFPLRNVTQTTFSFPLEILNAGNVLSSRHTFSLTVNNKLFIDHPRNAQIALHMAISLINSSLSRNCKDSVKSTMLAVSFINKYHTYRGECQEVFYNMGRFYHRINLEMYAIRYYEKCLLLPPVGNSDYEKSLTDLQKEAAFNLVYIYRRKHNTSMAAYLTQKYLVI